MRNEAKQARTLLQPILRCLSLAAMLASALTAAAGRTPPAGAGALVANAEAATHADPAGEMTHLLVGRSILLNSQTRLRRVYVSNPAVLDSYTASPNQIVITGKATGVGTVVLWDEKGASQVHLFSVDVDIEGLRKALKETFPKDQIDVEGREDTISLSGTMPNAEEADAAVKLAGLYAKGVANSFRIAPHVREVRLKVRILEVDRTKLEQFGFNIFGVGSTTFNSTTQQYPSTTVNSNSGSSTGSSSGNTLSQSLLALSNPLNFLLYNSKQGIGAAIQDLAERQVAQILAEPTITAEDGEKASFLSGGEFPFPVVQGGAGGLTSITIQFRPYGVKLDFTPTVTADGMIRLKVAPEVSALDYTNSVEISGYTIPAISTRRAETQVVLRDGETFAISGLLDHRTSDMFQKTPGIANIPILGELFKSKSINHSVVELMVLVTADLVDPTTTPSHPVEPTLAVPLLDPHQFDQKSGGKAAPGVQP